MSEKVEQYLHQIRTISRHLAEAKAQRLTLEHGRNALRAKLMKEAEIDGVKSAAGQERDALAHPLYKQHIEGLAGAVQRETELEWELKIAEWQIEIWRTQEASLRMERKSYAA